MYILYIELLLITEDYFTSIVYSDAAYQSYQLFTQTFPLIKHSFMEEFKQKGERFERFVLGL